MSEKLSYFGGRMRLHHAVVGDGLTVLGDLYEERKEAVAEMNNTAKSVCKEKEVKNRGRDIKRFINKGRRVAELFIGTSYITSKGQRLAHGRNDGTHGSTK